MYECIYKKIKSRSKKQTMTSQQAVKVSTVDVHYNAVYAVVECCGLLGALCERVLEITFCVGQCMYYVGHGSV